MKQVVHIDTFSGHKRKTDIEDFISESTEPDQLDYSGAVENARSHAREVAEMLGRLCQVLSEKGLLTNNELLEIGNGHKFRSVHFEEGEF